MDDELCKICNGPMDWEDCGACGGDGFVDVYEDDPLWYDPGDTEPCHQCGGSGGWWYCPNYEHHIELVAREIATGVVEFVKKAENDQ